MQNQLIQSKHNFLQVVARIFESYGFGVKVNSSKIMIFCDSFSCELGTFNICDDVSQVPEEISDLKIGLFEGVCSWWMSGDLDKFLDAGDDDFGGIIPEIVNAATSSRIFEDKQLEIKPQYG